MNRKKGNQPFTKEQADLMVSKLEPYLRSGLSIRIACLQSGVSRATLYRMMKKSRYLRDQIRAFQTYISLITSTVIAKQLYRIYARQQAGFEIDWKDLQFVMWVATNSIHCKEEFGRDIQGVKPFDVDAELHRIKNEISELSQDTNTEGATS